MGRPKLYNEPSESQAIYRKTEKGQKALKKYETSPRGKARKRRWWSEHHSTTPINKRQSFIDIYGTPQVALKGLKEREKQVLTLYFGLDGNRPKTLEEIGQHFNLSRERIRQIKSAALGKIVVDT